MRAEILIRKFKSARLLFLRKSHKSDELESFTVIETRDAQAPLIILKVGESETVLTPVLRWRAISYHLEYKCCILPHLNCLMCLKVQNTH